MHTLELTGYPLRVCCFYSHLSWEELGGDATVFDPSVDSGRGAGPMSAANINQHPSHHHHHYHHNIDTNNMIGRGVNAASFQPIKMIKAAGNGAVAEMIIDNKNWGVLGDSGDIPSSASFSHLQLMKAVAPQGAIIPDGGLKYDSMGGKPGVGFMAPMGAVHMHYSMLGLGDIVIPGLLLCFVLRFDYIRGRSQNVFRKDEQQSKMRESEDEDDNRIGRKKCFSWLPMKVCSHLCRNITIFHTTLLGYLLGWFFFSIPSEICVPSGCIALLRIDAKHVEKQSVICVAKCNMSGVLRFSGGNSFIRSV